MATKKKKTISASTASKSYNQKTIAKMKARDAGKSSSTPSSSSSKSTSSSTPVSSGKQVDTNLYLKQGETPEQYKARTEAYFASNKAPVSQPTDALKNLSIGMANGTITNQSQVGQQQSPEEWVSSFMAGMQGQNPDTSGVGTQSTQGDATAGEQPGVNDAVIGAMGAGGVGKAGSISGGSGGAMVPGQVTPGGTLMTGGTPMATVATGGYQKIGPAYFQKTSDGMSAVSDPTIISGLKHGTIPYSTGQLDGTTFSKNAVPLTPAGGATMPSLSTTQGADMSTTYNSMREKYNLTENQSDFFGDPMAVISKMTEKIYSMSGVPQANDAIKDITEDLEDMENKRDDEIADINDNPWLTEGVRLRQIASVESRYEDKIANRTNKLRLLEDVRNNAQQQAQFAIGTSISLWDKERTFQQHQIDSWNEQAQRAFTNDLATKNYNLNVANSEFERANAKTTPNAKDWLLAKEYGYKGSFYDWLNPPKDTGSSSGLGVFGSYAMGTASKNLSSIAKLKEIGTRSPGIFGASASMPVPAFLRSDDFRDYSALLESLKANIAFGELTAMREASKTGGALGAVSERELSLLENSLGALRMNQSPEQVMAELNQIESSITTWMNTAYQYGIQDPTSYFGGQAPQGEIVNAPDGTGPILIMPNNYSQSTTSYRQ